MVDWCKMSENFHAQLQLCCVKLIFVVCQSWMVCCIVSIVAEYQSHLLYRIHCGGVSSLSWHFTTHYVCDSFIMCCMTHYDCQSLSNSSHVLCCPLGFCLSLIMCDPLWLCVSLVMYLLTVCHTCHVFIGRVSFSLWIIWPICDWVFDSLCVVWPILTVSQLSYFMCLSRSSFVVWPIVTVCHTHHVVWSINYDCAVHCMTHCDCVSLIDSLWLPCRSCIQVMCCMTHYGVIQVMCCVTHYGYHTGHVLYDPLWLL